MTMEFNFVLSNNSSKGLLSNSEAESDSTLLTSDNNTSEISSLLSSTNDGECIDAFGGKDIFGSCDESVISNMNFVASNSAETAGSVAYNAGAETMGSVAFAGCGGAETAGSVACSSGSSDGGGCSCGGFSSFC